MVGAIEWPFIGDSRDVDLLYASRAAESPARPVANARGSVLGLRGRRRRLAARWNEV
jgi:hypothetical protein